MVESPTDSVALVRTDGLLLVRVPDLPPAEERRPPHTPAA